ncbi:MAG: GNAT family N-acetyltransferase [Lentisphaerae bacterium]|nr:GNAT family N-acetyltransferase [Lentisphaerota bacterium]
MIENEILKRLIEPPVLVEKANFTVKFAENPSEIATAQRLRYNVFMAEQGHMSTRQTPSVLDEDEFDRYCLHLIIVEKNSQEVIGTYRVHPGEVAVKNLGFYSQQEFKLGGLEKIAERSVEVGRSCIKPEYRNGAVVALLWAGMAAVHERTQCHYLLGCVSLPTADPVIGMAVKEYLKSKGDVFTSELDVAPQEAFAMPPVDPAEVERYITGDRKNELRQWIPPLLKGYLRLGARFGSEPVLDREFGAIDFLVLFNFDEIDQKYARHFL